MFEKEQKFLFENARNLSSIIIISQHSAVIASRSASGFVVHRLPHTAQLPQLSGPSLFAADPPPPCFHTPKGGRTIMAAADPWLKEFDEAEQVVNDAFGLLHERESNLREGRDVARLTATIRRKASTLSSKLESLSALLAESSV